MTFWVSRFAAGVDFGAVGGFVVHTHVCPVCGKAWPCAFEHGRRGSPVLVECDCGAVEGQPALRLVVQ